MANPMIPPMNPQQLGVRNPFLPPGFEPDPAPSPSLGFQTWASDARNAMKVSHAMTAPDAPLQPNAQVAAPTRMASANPPQIAAKPNPYSPPGWTPPDQPEVSGQVMPPTRMASANPPQVAAKPNPLMPPGYDQAQARYGADQTRLQELQQSGAGLNKIKNPFLRTIAKIGDIAAPFIIGRGAMAIPGTTAHNMYLQDVQGDRVSNDQAAIQDLTRQQLDQANLAHTQAETAAIPINAGQKRQTYLAALAAKGLREDEQGNIGPDENSPVYQQEQQKQATLTAQAEYARAGTQLRQAQAALTSAKNNPNSPAYKLALEQQNRLSAMLPILKERADATMGKYMQSAYNVGLNGEVLPGAMLTDTGGVVGTGNAANVRPTGQQRSKGNMAESADQQISEMKDIVAKRPDIFGPAGGRTTDFNVWVGSQDPDAQRFSAARTIAGDHLAGTFGGRSEAALNALDAAIGHFKDNPAAVTAGLNQLQEANRLFMKAGKVKTVGSAGNPMQPPTAARLPSGATHIVLGADKKRHYTNAAGTVDLGVVAP